MSKFVCFKPCYKWITFNTLNKILRHNFDKFEVLNLVINGLPSILTVVVEFKNGLRNFFCFKPCYKWITFNTNIKSFYWIEFNQ